MCFGNFETSSYCKSGWFRDVIVSSLNSEFKDPSWVSIQFYDEQKHERVSELKNR